MQHASGTNRQVGNQPPADPGVGRWSKAEENMGLSSSRQANV